MDTLDSPERLSAIRNRIGQKASLKRYYSLAYNNYADCLKRVPANGAVLELGSGGGFAKDIIPEIITSDVIAYEDVDLVIDATNLPFANQSLSLICMMNVFHHVSDVEQFLKEVQRCLVPGGRLFIADHHIGYISRFIINYFHHESSMPDAKKWNFESIGPLSGANTALPWIVFVRDIGRFRSLFPGLQLVSYSPHSPLWYWLSGGLKPWNFLPSWMFRIVSHIDTMLLRLSPDFGSFVNIEILRK